MSKNLLNVLLLISSFAVYYLLIHPVYSGTGGVWQPAESVTALQALSGQYDETLKQAETLTAQAETLKSQYMRISDEQKQKMEIMVPDSIDKIRLLSEADGMIKQSGLVPDALSYSEGSSNAAGRGSASLSFNIKATYPKFKELMDSIEKSMRLYSIQGVTFNAPGKEGDLTSFQVKLETYYIK